MYLAHWPKASAWPCVTTRICRTKHSSPLQGLIGCCCSWTSNALNHSETSQSCGYGKPGQFINITHYSHGQYYSRLESSPGTGIARAILFSWCGASYTFWYLWMRLKQKLKHDWTGFGLRPNVPEAGNIIESDCAHALSVP